MPRSKPPPTSSSPVTGSAPGWRQGQRLTITAIADLHAGGPNIGFARVREVVGAAQPLKSDLTVVLGDYFATHRFVTERVAPAAWAGELARLKAPLGVYSILGNHDWWYGIRPTRQALARSACRYWRTTPS
jgi:predicted MPP superfamily phosphohydrolase